MRALAMLLVTLVVAACGGADDAFSQADAPAEFVESFDADMAERGVADGLTAADEAPSSMPPVPGGGAPTGQLVVRTAYLALETDDSAAAYDAVLGVARRAGGYAATTDLQRSEDGAVTGWVTLRVPTDRLFDVVTQLEELGDAVPISRVDEVDVTTEATNLDARIENLRAYEIELLALLGEVRSTADPKAEDLVLVFERIRQTRQEIDQLEGHQRNLQDQISMATVTVELRQRAPVPTPGQIDWRPGETLQAAIAATARLLTRVVDGAIWLVVTAIPVAAAILVIPVLVVGLLLRRRRARRNPIPPPPGATEGASPTDDGR